MQQVDKKNELVDQKYKWFLYDLGPNIKSYLDDLIEQSKEYKKGTKEKMFSDGQLMSFIWFIEMLKQQAEGFDIGTDELRLNDINPEKDISKYIGYN